MKRAWSSLTGPRAPIANRNKRWRKVELSQCEHRAPRRTACPKAPQSSPAEVAEPVTPTVRITSPANEGTIAMGPGNFAVSASVDAAAVPRRTPGAAHGRPALRRRTERVVSWFVEGALRGPHDLVVQRVTSRGKTVALSEPVRIYVLRPSASAPFPDPPSASSISAGAGFTAPPRSTYLLI
jgi:hypothetical protein